MKTKQMIFCAIFFNIFSFSLFAQNTRPQTPVEPYPYLVENIDFKNMADSVTLAGTITIPLGKGSFPAVVLITGSGAQNRDEEIAGHKPFWVIADYLTRNGIAVLRVDDRTVGGSGRGTGDITTQSNARDVLAAIAYLKSRKEIDKKKIGLIGHSEGGTIAFILAAANKDIHFIVSLAGTGVGGDKILLSQQEIYFKSMGTPDKMVEMALKANKDYFEMVKSSEANNEEFKQKLIGWLKETSPAITPAQIESQLTKLLSPWMYSMIKYDPFDDIKKIKIPVLAINGKKDTQVISSLNLPAIETALKQGGNTHYKIIEPEDLNHLFQTCKTGFANEYQHIEETFSPAILDNITTWILKQ